MGRKVRIQNTEDEAKKAITHKINQQEETERAPDMGWDAESQILKKTSARQKRIKKESSDDCDIDDSTVGRMGWTDGREGGRIRRLRTSDQSTPGYEREVATGKGWRRGDEEVWEEKWRTEEEEWRVKRHKKN